MKIQKVKTRVPVWNFPSQYEGNSTTYAEKYEKWIVVSSAV